MKPKHYTWGSLQQEDLFSQRIQSVEQYTIASSAQDSLNRFDARAWSKTTPSNKGSTQKMNFGSRAQKQGAQTQQPTTTGTSPTTNPGGTPNPTTPNARTGNAIFPVLIRRPIILITILLLLYLQRLHSL